MTTDTITQRLHDQSDDKLKASINKQIDCVRGSFSCYIDFQMEVYHESKTIKVKVNGESLLNHLSAALFEAHKGKYRLNAVKDFMEKVESLASQVEEIQSRIQ